MSLMGKEQGKRGPSQTGVMCKLNQWEKFSFGSMWSLVLISVRSATSGVGCRHVQSWFFSILRLHIPQQLKSRQCLDCIPPIDFSLFCVFSYCSCTLYVINMFVYVISSSCNSSKEALEALSLALLFCQRKTKFIWKRHVIIQSLISTGGKERGVLAIATPHLQLSYYWGKEKMGKDI